MKNEKYARTCVHALGRFTIYILSATWVMVDIFYDAWVMVDISAKTWVMGDKFRIYYYLG